MKFEIIKFNPLLKWTLKEVEYYLEKTMPQNTLHKQDFSIIVRHVLEQFQMRILEPEEWWSRVTRVRITSKISCYKVRKQ
jgi:3'-phosphoadenosine 5'-phosphosulfate sulfotransferase (PAPS reductase)/FAD synthetase